LRQGDEILLVAEPNTLGIIKKPPQPSWLRRPFGLNYSYGALVYTMRKKTFEPPGLMGMLTLVTAAEPG